MIENSIKYIVENPVGTGIVVKPEDYLNSNVRIYFELKDLIKTNYFSFEPECKAVTCQLRQSEVFI